MKRAVVMLAALSALSMAGGAQAADLLDIYHDALASDAKLASARMLLEASREKYPQARAGLLPVLTLSGSSTYADVSMSLPSDRRQGFNTNSYTLQLTQPLFRWQNWVAYKQGELQVNLAEAQFASAQMDLIQRTAQAYFDLLNAQEVLKADTLLKTAANEQLQLSKKSFEVGTVTVTDVNDAQSRFDLASAQEIAAQNDVNVKREALRVLINKEPPQLAPIKPNMALALPAPADRQRGRMSRRRTISMCRPRSLPSRLQSVRWSAAVRHTCRRWTPWARIPTTTPGRRIRPPPNTATITGRSVCKPPCRSIRGAARNPRCVNRWP